MTLDKIWESDKLSRKEEADWLISFLKNRSTELVEKLESRSYVLNLDSQWGGGKTFFLNRLQQQLENSSHLAVYVNAWRDDFADDPLIAVMAAIDKTISQHTELSEGTKDTWKKIKEKTGQIARIASKGLVKRGIALIITSSATEAIDAILSESGQISTELETKARTSGDAVTSSLVEGFEKVIDSKSTEEVSVFRAQQDSMENFRKNLSAFVEAVRQSKGKNPFFVLIDELDRCRPLYAIEMLERIKHLFEIPGVVFIVATDSKQLSHSVRAIYGTEFDGARYLRRFFDQTYEFLEPSTEPYVKYLFERFPIDSIKINSVDNENHIKFISDFFDKSETDLRSLSQMYNHLQSLVSAWDHRVPIELSVALPLIKAFHNRDSIEDFENCMINHNPDDFMFSVNVFDPHSGLGTPQPLKVGSVAKSLVMHAMSKSLGDILSVNRNGTVEEIVRNKFFGELQIRANGAIDRANPMWSLIRHYPRLVRQAGRIKSDQP